MTLSVSALPERIVALFQGSSRASGYLQGLLILGIQGSIQWIVLPLVHYMYFIGSGQPKTSALHVQLKRSWVINLEIQVPECNKILLRF